MAKKYTKIAYCTTKHLVETGHVVEYFINNTNDFFLYVYPASFRNEETIFRHYKDGEIYSEKKIFWYKGNNKILIYFFIFIHFWYFIFYFKIKESAIIASHPIFLFLNTFQEFLFRNRIVFWIWDYFPSGNYLYRTYNFVVDFYVKRLDDVLFLTEAIKDKYFKLRKNKESKIIFFGLSKELVNRISVRNVLGFIGNLKDGQGFDPMFKLLGSNTNLKLEIVGNGATKNKLIIKTHEMGISDRVVFWGYQDNESLKKISSKWIAGLALYDDISNESIINFADPSKIKLYIELGISVIMTDVTYFASYIKSENAGVCVGLNTDEIQKEIDKINQNPDLYKKGIERVKEIFEFNNKYDNDFKFLQEL